MKYSFKDYLDEETTSGDIATVDTKLGVDVPKNKHLSKGKKCKTHKRLNCEKCALEEENKYE